jgi:EmrB/QacA subfamily drug resistance transporter
VDTRRRVWPVVLAVQLGVLLAALDATIVGTAMPTVIGTLGGAHLYPWVFSAYMLASTVVMPVFGGVSDRLGRRGPYVVAVAIFCAGSAVAGVAHSMPVLILARGLQGIGAGGLIALSLIIFGDLFSGPRRGQMQALITAVWGFASLVGPLLGGVIVDGWSWRWVFLINLPLGVVVVALVLGSFAGRGAHESGRGIDLPGVGTFLLGVTALMLAALDRGDAAAGGVGATRAVALGVAGLSLAAFVWVEWRSADPVLPLGLFRERAFAAGSAAAFFAGAAMFGALVHVPLLVQWGQAADATTAGLALMTASTGWSMGGLLAGQSVNRLGSRGLTIGGAALMTVAYTVLALRPDMTRGHLMATGGALGVGMGLVSVTLVLVIQTLTPPAQRGVATAGALFFRNIGATLGVTLMGAILTTHLGVHVAGIEAGGSALPPALVPLLVEGIGRAFWLGVGGAGLAFVAVCLLPEGRPGAGTPSARGEVLG